MSRRSAIVVLLAALLAASAAHNEVEDRTLTERVERFRTLVGKSADEGIAPGSLATVEAYVAEMREQKPQDRAYARRLERLVKRILDSGEAGTDLVSEQRGFFWRGYHSRQSAKPQLYSIYVPRNYEGERSWPLIVSLHGGSSNHNVWMAMILGTGVPVAEYRRGFRARFRAARHQDQAIVVSPQGMGQNHWLAAAQQDILDVLEDVSQHYRIDPDRVYLNGLSNGAVASYKVGLTHAWRFAAVLPMSGIVDWPTHAGAGMLEPVERQLLANESPLSLAENAGNTYFQFYHGVRDSGFHVGQARRFATRLDDLDIDHRYHEIPNQGHMLTHVLWRDFAILREIKRHTRDTERREVSVVATSERSGRQFWVVLEERDDHTRPGRIRARFDDRDELVVETENVRALSLLLSEAPVSSPAAVRVDGQQVDPTAYRDRGTLGLFAAGDPGDSSRLTTSHGPSRVVWRVGVSPGFAPGTRKTARLAGPLGDVGFEPQVHVYGTLAPDDTATLRKAAELGAREWTRDRAFSQVRHPVVADHELTGEMLRSRALVLYGNAANNSVLADIGAQLPIAIGRDGPELRGQQLRGEGIGARFVCPNPLAPQRYLVVQTGTDAEAVARASNLPRFLPDYVVFDERFQSSSPKLVTGRTPVVEMGYFTEGWQLPPSDQKKKAQPDLSGWAKEKTRR